MYGVDVCVGYHGTPVVQDASLRLAQSRPTRHARVIPVAVLLGALLVSLADTLGRTVIAPAQIPAGLVTAMVGTPYFSWLLWRTRRAAAG